MRVYLESGSKKVFACALDWPGYCRSGKTDDEALAALVGYGSRYAAAIGSDAGFEPPTSVADLEVVERLDGGGGTDFGVPSEHATTDHDAVDEAELGRLRELLSASWTAFDAAAGRAVGHELRKGPRGGGRDRDKIVDHVLEAEEAYLKQIGGSPRDVRDVGDGALDGRMTAVRWLAMETMADRAHGMPPPESPRRKTPYWSVRYYARRSAWHALDHAWEIEDRLHPPPAVKES
jgi:hypothetical protein